MVRVGIALIIGGLVVLGGYGLYEMLMTSGVPVYIRVGVGALVVGFVAVVAGLARERFYDQKREAEEDDFSHNP